MAVFTIAGLTFKEAVRRKTLVGALLLGLLVLGVSLLLVLIKMRLTGRVEAGRISPARFEIEYAAARSIVLLLSLFTIRVLGSLFAILLAGGSISGEIERGVLAVILPKPLPRWQILFGKWLGLNLVLVGSVLVWTAMVWASFTWQTHLELTPILWSGGYLILFPVVICTLTLALSTFSQRLLGTSLALTLAALSWFDGIFNLLGDKFDVDILHTIADAASLIVPQGYIAWWVEGTIQDLLVRNPMGDAGARSSQFLQQWGEQHLHYAHLDAVYVAVYILVVFVIGGIVFHKRDV